MTPAEKYDLAKAAPKGLYRLTLTAEAFALAVSKNSIYAGVMALKRKDGRWDAMVPMVAAGFLIQLREEGEHLTDVVVRHLTVKS